MNRGVKPKTEVADSLKKLLQLNETIPEGFIPFKVVLGTSAKFCFAKTPVDAKRKVLNQLATAQACSIAEILQAAKDV